MKQRIIFATGNKNKMREIHEILGDLGWEILSMKEAGIDVDIVEDGTTFEENALIKAKAVAAHCNDIVLADDSGLEIDYLNKEPGIQAFILHAMREKILPMILKIRCCWIDCRACRRRNVRHDLCVRSRR